MGPPLAAVFRRLLTWVEDHPASALLLIMLLTLVLGIAQLRLHPPGWDFNWENRWWQIAVNVARGDGYVSCKPMYFPFCGPANQVTAMREPLPVLLFALIALVTGESLLAAAAAGVIVNLGTVVAVFFLTRELADTRTAVLAALLWGCYLPPVRLFYAQPSGDLLAALAVTSGVFHFLRARRTGRRSDWLAAGVWLGLAILSRSAALIIALVLTAGQLLRPHAALTTSPRASGRSLRPVALFALAWALTASPWLVRNYLAFDRPVIGSTLSGYYLYRQNHMLPSDKYLRFVSGGEFVPVLHQMIARRPDLRGTENEAAMSQVYREEALRIIRAEPLRYVVLSAYRFLILWFNWGVKGAYGQQDTPGDYLTMIQHALLLAGGAVGLRGRWRRAWPLAASVAALSLLYMAVMALVTYVVAVVPLLVALSAIACTDIASKFASRGWAARAVSMRAGAIIGLVGVALGMLPATQAWAQADSAARPQQLEERVVVAHRAPTMLRESVAATTVLDRFTLERLPVRTLTDALRYVPGLTFVARDGAGELPMAIARGFFGGGETDYVLLTVDGTPVNDLRTGSVEWTQIPLAAIERIEVLRGGASIAYGDAALGAVVNVVTRGAPPSHHLISELQLGSWGDRALRSFLRQPLGSDNLGGGVAAARVDGSRSHARATNVAVSASYTTRPGGRASGYAKADVQRLRNQEPGPLTPEQIARDPSQHNPLFISDERRRDRLELGTGVARALGAGRLTGDLRARVADDEQTRTLPLSPNAGDTQFQDARSWDVWARLQYSRRAGRSTIVAGVEAERGAYDSRYTDPADRRALRSRGDGSRNKIGQYAELQRQLGGRLRAVAGIRYDLVTLDGTGSGSMAARFNQWSPRVGLNFAYAANGSQAGNVYVAWTRSFKAPTSYQLYDVRLISTGEPGVVLNLSNPRLRPQHSSGVELGVYHSQALWGTHAVAELTFSAYRLDVSDEIDFDLRTFKYGNILESRHDGLEGSLVTHLSPSLSLRHALTLMRVTFRSGDDTGNRLRNVPETVITNGAHISLGSGVEGTVTHRYLGGLFLDDANRERLPGSHRIDATVSWAVGAVRLHLTGVDLSDSHASTGGFLVYDPDREANVRMLYPEGGRFLRAGVTVLR